MPTPEAIAAVEPLLRQGLTLRETAARTRLSLAAVRSVAAAIGWTRKWRASTPKPQATQAVRAARAAKWQAQVAAVEPLLREGLTQKEAAARTGIHFGTVSRVGLHIGWTVNWRHKRTDVAPCAEAIDAVLPDDRIPAVEPLLRAGLTLKEVTARTRLTFVTVRSMAAAIGWTVKWRKEVPVGTPRKLPPDHILIPELAWADNLSAVARRHGVCRQRIHQVAVRLAEEIRRAREAPVPPEYLLLRRREAAATLAGCGARRAAQDALVLRFNAGEPLAGLAFSAGLSRAFVVELLHCRSPFMAARNEALLSAIFRPGADFGAVAAAGGVSQATLKAVVRFCNGGRRDAPAGPWPWPVTERPLPDARPRGTGAPQDKRGPGSQDGKT